MLIAPPTSSRSLKHEELSYDFVVIGGGLAGVSAAVSAARRGLKTALVQDRPILGGNSSSEVRLWVLGATSHMGNNNRWAREGGFVNEFLEDNLLRNRQGNPLIFDTILLEKCLEEENLKLFLNTAVYELEKKDPDTIASVKAFCPQNSTQYRLTATLFCDASGDGIVGFMAGAAFRMGAESKEEFGEGFAPDRSYGELLGHSMYFYSKDVGVPVEFHPPSWALKDITKIPRYRQLNTNLQGCMLWWLEYGGALDTVTDTETIKWELWKVVYGVWNHIKNSGEFPEAETLTLEWVGHIPGKRESRRFEGDYLIRQQDIVQQTAFDDVVAHGGWAIDLHPAEGVYSKLPGCTQFHSKGVYGIPYRCYYSRNISNLFLAGRIISATHVAFGSTRVMATCAAGGVAVGNAAAICHRHRCQPRDLARGDRLVELQTELHHQGQFLPHWAPSSHQSTGLEIRPKITASSELSLAQLSPGDEWATLNCARALLLPLSLGDCPTFTFECQASQECTLTAELWRPERPGNFTLDQRLVEVSIHLPEGSSKPEINFGAKIGSAGYHFIKLAESPQVEVRLSEDRYTGVLTLSNQFNRAVAKSSVQQPPPDSGIDSFEFWLPARRPGGKNLAVEIAPPIAVFQAENVMEPTARPTTNCHAWVAAPDDESPHLRLDWDEPTTIHSVALDFDPDWDHPMETVLITHHEPVSPFLIRNFDLLDDQGSVLAEFRNNHHSHVELRLDPPIKTNRLVIRVHQRTGPSAAIFRVQVV